MAEANLTQPAEGLLLVEWRRDGRAHRFDGKASWFGVSRGMGQSVSYIPPVTS